MTIPSTLPDTSNLAAAVAFVTIAGFAIQRLAEALNPLLAPCARRLSERWTITAADARRLLAFSLTVIFAIALASQMERPVLEEVTGRALPCKGIDWTVTVLLLSAGTEGANSILKGLEYGKRALKLQKETGTKAPERLQLLNSLSEALADLDWRSVPGHDAVFQSDPGFVVDRGSSPGTALSLGTLPITYRSDAKQPASDDRFEQYFESLRDHLIEQAPSAAGRLQSLSPKPRTA